MDIRVYSQLDESNKKEWHEFWKQCGHAHFRQHYLLGEIEKAKGRMPCYIIGKRNGRVECVGVFSLRPVPLAGLCSFEAQCIRGPAFDAVESGSEYLSGVLEYFKSIKVGSVRISPYWFYPEAESVEVMLSKKSFSPCNGGPRDPTGLVDLRRPEEDILASFSKTTRKEIRTAEKLGITVEPAKTMEEALPAYTCLSAMRRKRGITGMSLKEFQATFDRILSRQEMGILFTAKIGDEFLGARWNINGSRVANGAGYAIASDASQKLPAHLTVGVPLYWRAFLWSKDRGCDFFDLEGDVLNRDPSSPTYLVSQFKRRFNPAPFERINEHIHVCNRAIHAVHKQFDTMSRIRRLWSRILYRAGRNEPSIIRNTLHR
jgi:hypothetical protein